jgi:hypothetical protein
MTLAIQTVSLGWTNYAELQLVEALHYKPKVAGSISDGVIGIFH